MYYVDRSRVDDPFAANNELGQRAAHEDAAAREFFADPQLYKKKRFQFQVYRDPLVRAALEELFHGKCAYCETPINTASEGGTEPFRPLHSVIGAPDHPGYWWLANTWENLMLACSGCSQNARAGLGHIGKGGRFPMHDETSRANSAAGMDDETPLLLSPTRAKDIAAQFLFDTQGFVFGLTTEAKEMIKTFDLNRVPLVMDRQSRLDEFGDVFDVFVEALSAKNNTAAGEIGADILGMRNSAAPYSEMITQVLEMFLEHAKIAPSLFKDAEEDEGDKAIQIDPTVTPLKHKLSEAHQDRRTTSLERAKYDLSDPNPKNLEMYRKESRPIEAVSMTNFRGLGSLDFWLSKKLPERMPWKVLLGENGEGKSTVLQAIAIAISGPNSMTELLREKILEGSSFLRDDAKSGEIAVKVKGFDDPFTVRIFADRLIYHHPTNETPVELVFSDAIKQKVAKVYDWPVSLVLLGYGATRLSPTKQHPPKDQNGYTRVRNLFDPYSPLIDAEAWLLSKERTDEERWKAEEALRDLMSLDEDAEFSVTDGRLTLREHNHTIPRRQWSSGYQSIFAATIDIIQTLTDAWGNLRYAEGIVLIDELDAHLHPRWQMRIVDSLRSAFPNVQIIASTHQHLCLRGLQHDEVTVLFREPETGEIALQDNLPATEGMRTDQILKSEYFGLYTTDPEIDAMVLKYQFLRSKPDRTDTETQEMETLKNKLGKTSMPGESALEQVVYQVMRSENLDPLAPISTLRRKPRKEILKTLVDRINKIEATQLLPPVQDDDQ